MNRTVRSFVVLFALLALAGAQVFGLQRGFLCECSGEAVETSYEYCHHVHGDLHAPCEEDHHEHDGTVPRNHEHENQGGSHEHTPLKVNLTAASQGKDTTASVAVPVPVLIAIAELPDFLSFLLAAPGDTTRESATLPYIRSSGPPGIRETAKCMVLLI
ncbi:hypothetical protein DES53_106164 [Roseimicrobium gellanilyticum]|uniref:Uncharacterized protein n=1 Tax=Roseimicrobium gellanilyticum TaxID=748857 RepID=A0A366HI74_9BACT|nr:hypothetical protein [Roseimicrobium gellanilyticum]RBP42456.1 hypothetical protein DES53_106164 [Roseimicrobium gellanilyticum]